MYVPRAFAVTSDAEVDAIVPAVGAADLVTVGADGTPVATRMPVLWDRERSLLTMHMARLNDHWRTVRDGDRALAVVTAPEAYVSPSWYAAKAEHGRVVPTWDYSAVHLTGTVTVHDDVEWLRDMVSALTAAHEEHRPEPWAVTDAPERFVDGQLRAIVGLALHVERVEAKAKLSQNRSEQDRAGVVAGLRATGAPSDATVADAVERTLG